MIGDSAGSASSGLKTWYSSGIDGALHDVLAEAPGRVDQHDLVEAGLGVDREHHAGAAEVGAHHALDADRERDLHVVEALGLPIADRAVGEERGVAAPAGVEQRALAPDVEEGLLLAGEARIGQVLGGGARAHRDVGVRLRRAPAELAVGGRDGVGGLRRPFAAQEGAADRLAGLGERYLAALEIGEGRGDAVPQPVRVDEAPIGVGRRGEAGRHPDALRSKIADHLAERGVLAADAGDVAPPELLEPDHLCSIGYHSILPRDAMEALGTRVSTHWNRRHSLDARKLRSAAELESQWIGDES